MKIWIINQYASLPSTGIGTRHRHLARELVELGHEVSVIAARWSHLTRDTAAAEAAPSIEHFEGFRFVSLNLMRYKHAHDKRRFVNWFYFAFKVLRARRLLNEKPDVILYSSPSLIGFLSAECLARRYKARLLFEVRDIWPMTLMQIGKISERHPVIRFFQWIENRAYRKADLILSNLPGAIDHMKTRGVREKDFKWIPNGVSLPEMQGSMALDPTVEVQIPKDKFVVGFTGTLAVVASLQTLLDAAKLTLDDLDIVYVIVGHGMEGERLKARAKREGLTNVHFTGAVPKSQVQSAIVRFDACWIGWKQSPLYDFGVAANKLFDYFYAARPVLHSYSGKYDPVQSYGAGLSVPAQDPEKLAAAVRELKGVSLEQREEMGKNGREAVFAHHEYVKLARALETAILSLQEF